MTSPPPAAQCSCPCGLAAPYEQCCGRWHHGPLHLQAPDAERLMRSRYCAYVMGLTDYLLQTWHPRTRPAQIEPNAPGLRWLGLQVRSHTQLDATHARVDFVARSKLAGRATRHVEASRFERVAGRWLYVDAEGQAAAP